MNWNPIEDKGSLLPLAVLFLAVSLLSTVIVIGLRYNAMVPSECHIVFGGIRLHYLHVFPLSSQFLDNYLKSMAGNWFGWIGYLFAYVSSIVMSAVGIPLSIWNLYLAHIAMGVAAIGALLVVVQKIYRHLPTTMITGILAFLSMTYLLQLQLLTNYLQSYEFLIALFLLVIFRFQNSPGWLNTVVFSAMLFLVGGSESLLAFPFLIVALFPSFYAQRKRLGLPRVALSYAVIWVPGVLALLMHLYIYFRLGDSNLGMFGLIINTRMPGTMSSLVGFGALLLAVQAFLTSLFRLDTVVCTAAFAIGAIVVVRRAVRSPSTIPFDFTVLVLGYVVYTAAGYSLLPGHSSYQVLFVPYFVIVAFGIRATWIALEARLSAPRLTWVATAALTVYAIVATTTAVYGLPFPADQPKPFHVNGPRPFFSSNPRPSSELKVAGYYIREHGQKDWSVYNLFTEPTYLFYTEYYYGRLAIAASSFGHPNLTTMMDSSTGPNPPEKYEATIGHPIDFYVAVDRMVDDRARAIIATFPGKGIRKVADVYVGGKKMASVYSPRDLPYQRMDYEEYSPLFDREFANLANLFYDPWCGMVSEWGNY